MTAEEIQALALSKLPPELKDNPAECMRLLALSQIQSDNAKIGEMDKIDGVVCDKCKNKGYTVHLGEDNLPISKECDCMSKRLKIRQRANSGLGKRFSDFTFDKFSTNTEWQKIMLDKGKKFCYNDIAQGQWIYYCGASGSGKSSICSAICNKLIEQGKDVKYYSWRVVVNKLKDMSRISERLIDREQLLKGLQRCEVLFLDDLFKTLIVNGAKQPLTASDVNITRDILDYRYNEMKTTVLTGEFTPNELLRIDEALGSRIIEMTSPEYLITIVGKDKNIRLNGGLRK